MVERRRSRSLLAVLVLASLALLTLDYRDDGDGSVTALQRQAQAAFAPLQEAFAGVVQPVGGFFSAIGGLRTLREENAALETELQELRDARVSQADIERENAELRELLDMQARLGVATTGALVIAQPSGSFNWSVLIDAGADQGLLPGMAVVNGDGLVGKLVEVTAGNARVQLLTSPDAGYAVRVADTGEQGRLTGRGSEPFQLEVINQEAEVAAGAEIVTHAFAGTSILDGVPIGTVAEGTDPDRGSRYLSVRPYVDFGRLGFVQVVLDQRVYPEDLPLEERIPGPDLTVPSPAEGEEST